MPSSPAPLGDVVALARPIVERIAWCGVSTTDGDEVRARLMHPVWWWPEGGDDGAPTAIVSARPTPVKVRHLAERPNVSCFYWDPAHDTVAIDAVAAWVPAAEVADAWEAVKGIDPPVGFDPALIWPDGPESADCGFLRLRATRIVATAAGQPGLRWTARGA